MAVICGNGFVMDEYLSSEQQRSIVVNTNVNLEAGLILL
jgi:hypothetical protein